MSVNIAAIITARGGSKGIPQKNIVDVAGQPLIAYTIQAAANANIFDTIMVTTDDVAIKDVAEKYGADIIDRPASLATDEASSLDVISHALSSIKHQENEYFVLLQPTSPLRNKSHILEAWEQYCSEDISSLVSVVEEQHSPYKLLTIRNQQAVPLFGEEYLTMPRQQLPATYRPNGAIYISRVDQFIENQNLFAPPLGIYIMDKQSSLDIDTPADLEECERLIKKGCSSYALNST